MTKQEDWVCTMVFGIGFFLFQNELSNIGIEVNFF